MQAEHEVAEASQSAVSRMDLAIRRRRGLLFGQDTVRLAKRFPALQALKAKKLAEEQTQQGVLPLESDRQPRSSLQILLACCAFSFRTVDLLVSFQLQIMGTLMINTCSTQLIWQYDLITMHMHIIINIYSYQAWYPAAEASC